MASNQNHGTVCAFLRIINIMCRKVACAKDVSFICKLFLWTSQSLKGNTLLEGTALGELIRRLNSTFTFS